MTTIEEAQQELKKNIIKGIKCPCCSQFAKLYFRTITSSMAMALIMIYKADNGEYFHVEDYLKAKDCPSSVRGDFPKLRFWGLIEPKPGSREDGSDRNGYYRITEQGRSFARNEISVSRQVKIYNNQFYGFDGKFVNIEWCIKKKFSYKELMDL